MFQNGESGDDPSAGRPAASTDGAESPTTDELLQVLTDARRRALIWYLSSTPEAVHSLEECAHYLDGVAEVHTVPGRGSTRVEATLHHVHLPKLAAAGVVEYDAERQEVSYLGSKRLETSLQVVTERPSAEVESHR